MKRIFKILIITLLLSSMLLSACSKGSTTDGDVQEIKTNANAFTYSNGIHNIKAPEVEGEYIIKDGKFLYTLVFPDKLTGYMSNAKSEFLILMKRATGISVIPTTTESHVSEIKDTDRYISFGDTSLVEKAGVTYDKAELKKNGLRIITKDKNIFLFGGQACGMVNAVYKFMEICFNYECYSRNCIEIDTGVINLKLRNFNVTDVPDIDASSPYLGYYDPGYRTATQVDKDALYSEHVTNEEIDAEMKNIMFRMHMPETISDSVIPVIGTGHVGDKSATQHTTLNVFSRIDYPDMDERWFAESHNQICWTAHGDAESLEKMKDHAFMILTKSIMQAGAGKAENRNAIMLGNEDGGGYCNCTACMDAKEKDGGSMAGASIRFANDIIERIYQWFDTEEGAPYKRENFRLVIFAYSALKDPPVFKNAQGEWQVVDGCKMDPRVCVWLTATPVPYLEVYDPLNQEKIEETLKWGLVADHVWYWQYAQFYGDPIYALDFLNGANGDRYKMLASLGAEYILTEIDLSGHGPVCWGDLFVYVINHLAWDCNLDENILVEKWFNAMYGVSADTMLSLYNDQKLFFQSLMRREINEMGGNGFINIGETFWDETYYPYPVLEKWVGMLDKALLEIEPLKLTDERLYNTYKDRIDLASTQFLGVIFDIYGSSANPPFDKETKEMYKMRLLSILDRYKVSGLDYDTILQS